MRIHLRIDTIRQMLALQARDQILRRHPGHFIAGRFAGTGDVRRDDNIIQCQQWTIQWKRFRVGHIQPGGKDALVLSMLHRARP